MPIYVGEYIHDTVCSYLNELILLQPHVHKE